MSELKQLPDNRQNKLDLRKKRNQSEKHLKVTGSAGNRFKIIFRESLSNPRDFSVILSVQVPSSNQLFRLRRYNGKSHEHTNTIENERFYDYHIHFATERYQKLGTREDTFAEPTTRFVNIREAWSCMVEDANIRIVSKNQEKFF